MECNEIRALLSLYIDQMLDKDQMEDVEKHLSDCNACREEYESLHEIHSLLGQLEEVPVPESFDLRLKKALQEEKVQMIDADKAENKASYRKRFRVITSLAAVFVVGIMTFALYHDVLGDLNARFDGAGQTGSVSDQSAAGSDLNGSGNSEGTLKKESLEVKNKELDEAAGNLQDGIQDDKIYGAAAMDADPGNKPKAAIREEVQVGGTETNAGSVETDDTRDMQGDTASLFSADAAGGSDPNYSADTAGGSDSDYNISASENAEAGLPDEEALKNSKMALPQNEACSRSLTSSGVERNSAAVQFYNGLIEKKLEDFDYQVLESNYAQTGQWNFRILIFRDKDGNTYNEEILVIGKDGEIEIVCSNELMGL